MRLAILGQELEEHSTRLQPILPRMLWPAQPARPQLGVVSQWSLQKESHVSRDCKCQPDFGRVTILGTHRDRATREIIEAFHISRHGHSSVSEPSLAPSAKQI
ncbi:uncharacterized protein ISCGN_024198 [Ixodes scapularis]